MAESLIAKLVIWGIFIIFIIVFANMLYSDEGILQSVAKFALKAERFLPSGPNQEIKDTNYVDESTAQFQSRFILNLDATADEAKCFINFDKTKLGKIKMELKNENGKLTSTLLKDVQKQGSLRLNPISTSAMLSVCSIEPKSFRSCYNGRCQVMAKDVGTAVISAAKVAINGEAYGAASLLYKPASDKVCVIPLHGGFISGCDAEENTIDEACIKDLKNLQYCKA